MCIRDRETISLLSTSDFDVDVTRLKKLMNFEINKSSENGVTIVNVKPKLESIVLKRCQDPIWQFRVFHL